MRIVKEIIEANIKISIFSWNGKYLIKLEQGDLEQTYKLDEYDILSEKDLDTLLSKEFLKDIQTEFMNMNALFAKHSERIL